MQTQIHSHVKPVEDGQVGFSHAHQNYQLFTFPVLSSFLNIFFYFFHQAELPAVESLQVVQSLLTTAGKDYDDIDDDDDDDDDDGDDDDYDDDDVDDDDQGDEIHLSQWSADHLSQVPTKNL